jgi:predicted MFS family arabinose efflux permease
LFGPIIGSLLNSAFGYSIPFFIIAILFLIAVIFIQMQMPSDSQAIKYEEKRILPIFKAFQSGKVRKKSYP